MSEGKQEPGSPCECDEETNKYEKCPIPENVTHPLRYYEFTKEEIHALEECDSESFYRRCLPFSTILMTLTYAGIKNGRLQPHSVLGPWPKLLVAMMIGHALGRLSYIHQCDKIFRRLSPKSHLGNTMRHYYEINHPKPKK